MIFKDRELEEYIRTQVQICSKCSWGDNELLGLDSDIPDKIQNEDQAYFEICPVCKSFTIWIEVSNAD